MSTRDQALGLLTSNMRTAVGIDLAMAVNCASDIDRYRRVFWVVHGTVHHRVSFDVSAVVHFVMNNGMWSPQEIELVKSLL